MLKSQLTLLRMAYFTFKGFSKQFATLSVRQSNCHRNSLIQPFIRIGSAGLSKVEVSWKISIFTKSDCAFISKASNQ